MQWDGTAAGATPIINWVLENNSFGSARYHSTKQQIAIDTIDSIAYARINDWIVQGVAGEFYPCRSDIFTVTYEPIREDAREPQVASPTPGGPQVPDILVNTTRPRPINRVVAWMTAGAALGASIAVGAGQLLVALDAYPAKSATLDVIRAIVTVVGAIGGALALGKPAQTRTETETTPLSDPQVLDPVSGKLIPLVPSRNR